MIDFTLASSPTSSPASLRLAASDTPDTVVSGAVDTDSRLIGPGGIFVAKPGEVTDGHLFVDAAVAAGAVARDRRATRSTPRSRRSSCPTSSPPSPTSRATSSRACAPRATCASSGITGSNGKTTTKNLLARILEAEGETVSPRASFNNEVGAPLTMLRVTDHDAVPRERVRRERTGRDRTSRRSRRAGCRRRPHGRAWPTPAASAASKRRSRPSPSSCGPCAPAGSRCSTPTTRASRRWPPIAAERDAAVRWFGRGAVPSDVRADDVEVTASGTHSTITADGVSLPLHLRVLGEHHVMNALAAIAAATALGVSLQDCVARLETVELAERWRMQPMGSDRVRIINDAYNASPDSMSAALRTLAQITGPGERTVAVLGAMSELGEYAERGARPRRPAGGAARHPAHRRRRARGAADVPRGRRRRARGTARRSSSPPPTRPTTISWASCATAIGCSSSPPTRRVCGTWAIVWENRSREITPDGGGDLAGLHPVPHARLPAAVPQVGLGSDHPHARGRQQSRRTRPSAARPPWAA